jgi:multiple sugar transport system permease protein
MIDNHRSIKLIISILALILVFFFVAMPLLWMIATSFREPSQSFRIPPSFFPKLPLEWDNYKEVFTKFPFFRSILNSVIVTVVAVSGQLIISSLAAFALTRFTFKGREAVFILILAGMMVPAQVVVIPVFLILRDIHLLDTLSALILPSMVFPMSVFLLRQHLRTIPLQFDEAAAIDGLGRLKTFFYVILPMMKPALLVAAFMHILLVWNDFFRPLIFINSIENMTLPIGLYQLKGYLIDDANVTVILAGVVISVIPPLVFYGIGQKYIVEGVAVGGIKG